MTSTATDRRLGLNSGAAIKVPCITVASTAVVLSGEQTIGGVAVHAFGANGGPDRVLVTGGSTVNPGSTSIDNGIWQVATGAWLRDIDFNGVWDVLSGALVPVYSGGTYTQYVLTTPNPISIGSTALSFAPIGSVNEPLPSVFDFMSGAQIADVQARTKLLDVTIPLQSALNTGKLYFMPDGDYLTTGALTKTSNWGGLVGSGMGTRIITNHGTADVFTIGDGISQYSGMTFKDFRIWSTVTKSAGYCFNCKMIARSFFENVHAGSLDDYVSDGNTLRLFDGYYFDRFSLCDIIGGEIVYSDAGLKCRGNSDQSFGAELTLTGGLYITGGSGTSTKAVWCGGGAGGIYLDRVSLSLCGGYGLYVDDTLQTATPNREIVLGSSCTIDTCTNWGVYLASDSVSLIEMNDAWVAGCGTVATNTGGVNSQPSTGVIPEIKMTGCQIYSNYSDGVQLNKCSPTITGCIIRNNGTGVPGGHGILIADVNDKPMTIDGCFIHNNGNVTRGYGISITSGAQDLFIIQGNNLSANGQGAIFPPSNTTTAIIRNNVGYVTENSGTATILNGAATVVVNHGLAAMPSFVTAWFASNPVANAQLFIAPANFTSTQFTVNSTQLAGAPGMAVGWRAIVGTQ